ncbi:MAG: hypothetical protein AB8C84_01470 [Oligoflexales bacterium]
MLNLKSTLIYCTLFAVLSCGTAEEDTEPQEHDNDPKSSDVEQSSSHTFENDNVHPPAPITGAYLSCQKVDVYTYCRIQASYSNIKKINQDISWEVSSYADDIEYLDEQSSWHIRIENSDEDEVSIHATLPSKEEFSYFHNIKRATDTEKNCPPYTTFYQDNCIIAAGRNTYTQKNITFSNLTLENDNYSSFRSYLPYPMIYIDESLEVELSIDWEQSDIQCDTKNCDTKFAVFLLRQNSQKKWIKRSYLCFEPDLFSIKGKFYGVFDIPDSYSIYYISQPIIIDGQCNDFSIEKSIKKIEVFGATLP